MRVTCRWGIDRVRIAKRHGLDLAALFSHSLVGPRAMRQLRRDGSGRYGTT
jgi:hypothetical protein